MNIQVKLLSSSFFPVPRQKQIDQLHTILSCKSPCQAFISGNPGTGKSAAISSMLPKNSYFVNCAKVQCSLIFKNLFNGSGLQPKTEAAALKMCNGKTLIFDEVDFLSNKKLYQILELKAQVILIANSLSFFESDARLNSRAQNLKQVVFNDYTVDDMISIAKFKVGNIFPDPVLRLGAQKVVNRAGDLRDYFDFLIRLSCSKNISLEGVNLILGTEKIQLFTEKTKLFMRHFIKKARIDSRFDDFQSPTENRQLIDYLVDMNAIELDYSQNTAILKADKRLYE